MRYLSLFFIVFLAFNTSCSKFRKIEKSQDWRIKYEAGLNYYGNKKYYKASILFEQILPVVRGLPEGEKVQFYIAYCQYYQKLYLMASDQFQTFYESYGRSTLVEEARFQYAYSLFLASPAPNLDQSSGIDAMEAMQQFINRYPNSTYKDKAVEVILASQDKLEKKGFENARQYYKMGWYNAGVVSLNNFKNNFPDSKYLEEAYVLIVQCDYKLARQSIPSKQKERFEMVVNDYKEFIDKFPESNLSREAEKYYSESLDWLNKYSKSNVNNNKNS